MFQSEKPLEMRRGYRDTMSVDCCGDSIVNSVFDIQACAFRFTLALRLEARYSIVLIRVDGSCHDARDWRLSATEHCDVAMPNRCHSSLAGSRSSCVDSSSAMKAIMPFNKSGLALRIIENQRLLTPINKSDNIAAIILNEVMAGRFDLD